MFDLQSLANISEIIGGIFVVGGIVFAIIQIRQFNRQREDTAAIELIRAWQGPEYQHALHSLSSLPDGLAVEEVLSSEQDIGAEAHIVCSLFESVGLMVYRRMLPLDIADELIGGAVNMVWKKLSPWIEYDRTINPKAWEWYEWLKDRFADMPNASEDPAYVVHRHWQP